MSLFENKKIEISNVHNATVTVGQKNIVTVSQSISEVKETNITNEGEKWDEVINQITALQKIFKEIPDEHEDVRDQELIPSASKAKLEAAKLKQNPEGEKQGFLSHFKSVCDALIKVADIAAKASPIVVGIANLLGIPLPTLPAQ